MLVTRTTGLSTLTTTRQLKGLRNVSSAVFTVPMYRNRDKMRVDEKSQLEGAPNTLLEILKTGDLREGLKQDTVEPFATKASTRASHKLDYPLGLLWASVITMIILVGPTMTGGVGDVGCPTGCNCRPVDGFVNILEVKCSDESLSDLPEMFNPSTVHTLDLSNNELSTLKNLSFFSYSSLSILLLSYNNLEEIEINAFAGLQMVKEIDLSYNILDSLNPEIFSANPRLDTVSLRENPIRYISSDSPILISTSVSFLDLGSCSLTSVNSVTFSRLPNLYSLDLSSNLLRTLSVTTFEKLPKLRVLKLHNNRWTCSCDISEVMQWLTVTIPQAPAHKPVKCFDGKIYRNLWTAAGGSQPCGVSTTTEALVGREREVTTDMSVDRQVVSVSVSQSLPAVPHEKSQRNVESTVTNAGGSQPSSVSVGREREVTTDISVDLTTVSVSVSQSVRKENKTEACDSLLCWDVNRLTVFVILPLTLTISVFVSVMAIKYFSKICKLNSPQHGTERKDGNRTGFFSRVPLLYTQLTADDKKNTQSS